MHHGVQTAQYQPDSLLCICGMHSCFYKYRKKIFVADSVYDETGASCHTWNISVNKIVIY